MTYRNLNDERLSHFLILRKGKPSTSNIMNKVSKRLYVPHKSGGNGYDHDLGAIAFGNPLDLVGKSDCERKRQKKLRQEQALNLKSGRI